LYFIQDAEMQYFEVVKIIIYTINITKNYFRVLEVLSSLNIDFNNTFRAGRKEKMTDIELVASSLTPEDMHIDRVQIRMIFITLFRF
jgi:hypothetical protein